MHEKNTNVLLSVFLLFFSKVGGQQPAFTCPNNANPLVANTANAAGVLICCSQASTVTPICPNNAIAQTSSAGYVECSISNPTNCIAGYQCVQSSNVATTNICCSLSTSTTSCPSDFTPAVSTSGGTSGYTCQLSVLLATYVCCGQGSTGSTSAGCADGRPVYQVIAGETYTCEMTSSVSTCPSGYDCAPSDDPFVDVCCLTGPSFIVLSQLPFNVHIPGSTPIPENLSCPSGWNPYRNEVDNAVRTCSAVLDTSCPTGFSCAPSSQASQFLCCRLASSLVCINGRTLLVNGAPKLCSQSTFSQCPYNYSCQQSINPTVTVCCSNAE
uniref:Uncharacterized protein n=1 Tax=Caenorhabditis japonica TaxID=281687 RepID=A0A8R1DT35_CAEJA